jgi:hypothetical protein
MGNAMTLGCGRRCCKGSGENNCNCKRECLEKHTLDFLLAGYGTAYLHSRRP